MASPWLLETLTRCQQMGPSYGSPRPICPMLATTLASLAMLWGRRPNTHSSVSWVSAGPPPPPPTFPPPSYQMLQEGTSNFHKQPLWRSSQISIAMPAGDQAFCTQAFPVTVHVQTVTVPPAGAGKESLGSKKQLDQKPPSPSSSEQEGCG